MLGVSTTDDLTERFRRDVDDLLRGPSAAPDNDCLWSIEDVNDYMQDASDKVARITLSQFKTFPVPVLAANGGLVALPDSAFVILDIRRVVLASTMRELHPRTIDMDGGYDFCDYGPPFASARGWEVRSGVPRDYIRDYVPGSLRLVPYPTVDDSITVTACISPALIPCAPLPFKDPNDVYLMLLWMKKLAYQKHDADTFDPDRAKSYADEYEARATARAAEARRIRRAVQPVKFSW